VTGERFALRLKQRRRGGKGDQVMHTDDPIELIIADGLRRAGIRFVHESDNKSQALDFSLPDLGVYIECKQFPSVRTSEQLAEFPNVILIQGRVAAWAFATMIAKHGASAVGERALRAIGRARWPALTTCTR
jgi:hypothetical protein